MGVPYYSVVFLLNKPKMGIIPIVDPILFNPSWSLEFIEHMVFMGQAVGSRIKTLDVGIPLLHAKSKLNRSRTQLAE